MKLDESGGLKVGPVRPQDELNVLYLKAGRAICVGLLAGIPAGVLVGGIGSRIAMRISALAGGEGIAGRLTENGNVVGEMTRDGTLFLVIFMGLATGIVGGVLYGIIRSWLPGSSLVRGVLYGLLLLAVLGAVTIDSGNRDFAELGPPGLNVGMFALLHILFGITTALAAAWLGRFLPRVTELRRRRYWYLYVVAPALLLLFPLGIGGVLLAVAVLAGVLALYALAHIWYPRSARALAVFPGSPRAIPYLALGVPAIIGSVFLARSVLAILR